MVILADKPKAEMDAAVYETLRWAALRGLLLPRLGCAPPT